LPVIYPNEGELFYLEATGNMRTAKELMTTSVPKAQPDETVGVALKRLREQKPEEASHLYLIDEASVLTSQVPIERLIAAAPETRLGDLRGDPPIEVWPDDDAEAVALLAVERHDADVAVVDDKRGLIGAIPIGRLLRLLHEEHVDDILRGAGVGAGHPSPAEAHETIRAFRARMPWLALGLLGGMMAGGVASIFEESLKREVTLAFFLPLVVYMADAIGTQTETILVRRMVYGRVSLFTQLRREASLGLLMGLTIGGAAWMGLWLLDGRGHVASVVALTILCSSIVATLIASLLPWMLDRMDIDPAMASGPVATVLQDLLSVAIYLGLATAII
jgi:magnesium transporter